MFVCALVLAVGLAAVMGILYSNFDGQMRKELSKEAAYLAYGVEQQGLDYLKNIKDKSARITYIDQDGTVLYFRETDPDKTTLDFGATVSVKRTGGGVNGVIEFEVTMTVQTDITYTDPA